MLEFARYGDFYGRTMSALGKEAFVCNTPYIIHSDAISDVNFAIVKCTTVNNVCEEIQKKLSVIVKLIFTRDDSFNQLRNSIVAWF